MEESKLTYVPPEVKIPEVTLKGTVLAIVLTIVMSASAMYLGLKVGLTISASIPAAVLSMGLLGMFRRHNILENNLVQTAASGGMCLASGVIFCLPALVILGVWDKFHYWETFTISLYGGLLGVMFSVPFRAVLLREPTLHYPEGTAITHVLQAKASGSEGMKNLLAGSAVGGLISFCQMGLKVLSETIDCWVKVGSTFIGMSLGFSPVLLGAGFIIGARVALVALAGVILGWGVGIPLLGLFKGTSGEGVGAVMDLWSEHLRFVGVGVLLVGGFWTFISLVIPFIKGLRIASRAEHAQVNNLRTEREFSMRTVITVSCILAVPIFFVYQSIIKVSGLELSLLTQYGMNLTLVIYTLLAGMVFSVICGYMVGMVGSSASPLSALALGAIIIVCLIILSFMGGYQLFAGDPDKALAASTLAITVGVVIICAAAITNDTIQDFKVGHMVGATPLYQQWMQILGVLVAALMIPPVLDLLFQAYGIADVLPRANMDPGQALAAPQAQLMAAIAKGVFDKNIPWLMISIGAIMAVITIIVDCVCRKKGYGTIPVIALGLGIYLPLVASTPLILGGVISGVAHLMLRKIHQLKPHSKLERDQQQRLFIMASGLIAGGSIVGVVLAVPFVLYQSTSALAIVGAAFTPVAVLLGLLATCAVCWWAIRLMLRV